MTKRVLVVEDDPVIRTAMLSYLNALGLNCYAVTTGEESVDLAEYFDLVLMDVELPGISGVEATQMIRRREQKRGLDEVPIIATTSNDNREECIAAGMNDHHMKPIKLQNLGAILKEWMSESQPKLRLLS